ncbi:MEDS domain-containing protein [Dactylosporangium sp. NPDC049140]|uniref:MEDS domain-containing protein n=1 Tax=Dactylosporangium sp. NPDC049140 TaxID=3155647 RepID=UPI0033FC7868
MSHVVGRLELGDHVCWQFDSEAVRRAVAAELVQMGLGARRKVVWCPASPQTAVSDLRRCGIEPGPALRSGQLAITKPADYYFTRGFGVDATVQQWNSESARACAEGYAGLQAIADMSWAVTTGISLDRLARYEAVVNRVITGGSAMAVCQYDTRLFNHEQLRPLAMAHPGTVRARPSTEPGPLLRIRRNGLSLRMTGECDLSNRLAIGACLADLRDDCIAAARPMTVDATALQFADAFTARLLINAAAVVPAGCTVICSPQLVSMFDLLGGPAEVNLRYRAEG